MDAPPTPQEPPSSAAPPPAPQGAGVGEPAAQELAEAPEFTSKEQTRNSSSKEPAPDDDTRPPAQTNRIEVSSETVQHSTVIQAKVVNIRNGLEREGEKPFSFEDPTEPLHRRPAEVQDLEIDEREQWISELDNHRALLLSSFQHEPALAVAYSLVDDELFAEYEKRTLILDKGPHKNRSDLTIDLFSQPFYLDQKKQIILVEIRSGSVFLDSIRQTNRTHTSNIRERLRERETILICAASCKLLDIEPDQRQSEDFLLRHRSVPFLPYVLRRHFTADRTRELEALLTAQWQRGLWGDSLADFYEQVGAYLRRGSDRLEEEIQRRESLPQGLSVRQVLEEIQPAKAAAAFREDSVLHGAVIYTAAYFPELTPQDFERVLRLLLDGHTLETEEEEQTFNEKGEVQTRKMKVVHALIDLWEENPDRILEECCLEAVPLRSGVHVLDFTSVQLRRELRSLLESKHSMLLVRMFKRLQKSGLLFAPAESATIVDNLIRLFVERTLSDPAFCGKDWLVSFVVSLSAHLQKEAGTEDPSERLLELLAELQNEQLRWHYYGRLAQLLREMLEHDGLRHTVRELLDTLLAFRQHEAALDIVLALTWRLRFAPQFDALSWMRRLIDQGTVATRERTYRCLLGLAADSGPRVFELLEGLRGWLPAADRERKRYSPSNRYALRFLFEHAFRTALEVPFKHLGEWPSRYALFASLPDDPTLVRARVELLADWLLHAGMVTLIETEDLSGQDSELRIEDKDLEVVHLVLVADLIEQWLLILEGTGPLAAGSGAHRIADEILGALARRASKPHQRHLVRRWQWRQQEYVEEINQLPASRREERAQRLALRRKIVEIKQRFVALASQ